jgi:PleD family two-component response regulator
VSRDILAKKGNILIVDDKPDNLRLLATMLGERGYKVRKAINGRLALMGVRAEPPDLILLDITMPDMNGYDVCQQLKADTTTNAIPVIFISALDEQWSRVQAFASGGVDYVTKPFQWEEVIARVETQMKVCRLQKQLQEHQLLLQQEIALRQQTEQALQECRQQKGGGGGVGE